MNRVVEMGCWLVLSWILIWVDKEMMLRVINISLPSTYAGLLSGILLGEKVGISKEFYRALLNSGLIHVVVVSGSNVMLLIGGVIETLASFIGRKKAIVVGMLVGWKYVVEVGWEVPVVRAMLMLSVLYLAQLLGRKYNLVRWLGLVILMMVIGEPGVILSVSFWLSITAFLGVVTSKGLLTMKTRMCSRNKYRNAFFNFLIEALKVFVETVWITVWITPILGIVFGRITLVAPLTNMVVLGLVAVVSVVGIIGAIVGLLWAVAGKVILWLTIPTLNYLREVVVWGGRFGGLEVEFNYWILLGYYLILGYWLLKRSNSK